MAMYLPAIWKTNIPSMVDMFFMSISQLDNPSFHCVCKTELVEHVLHCSVETIWVRDEK